MPRGRKKKDSSTLPAMTVNGTLVTKGRVKKVKAPKQNFTTFNDHGFLMFEVDRIVVKNLYSNTEWIHEYANPPVSVYGLKKNVRIGGPDGMKYIVINTIITEPEFIYEVWPEDKIDQIPEELNPNKQNEIDKKESKVSRKGGI